MLKVTKEMIEEQEKLENDSERYMDDIEIDGIPLSEFPEPDWGILLKKFPLSLKDRIKAFFKPREVEQKCLIRNNATGETRITKDTYDRYRGTKEGGDIMITAEFYEDWWQQ